MIFLNIYLNFDLFNLIVVYFFLISFIWTFRTSDTWAIPHVGKYNWANDLPKLAMLAIDIEPIIGLKMAPDYRPRITARVKAKTF